MQSLLQFWLPWISIVLSQSRIDSSSLECNSPLYCNGEILKRVQMNPYTQDGKYFVDMATAVPVPEVIQAFNNLPLNATKAEWTQFMDTYFYAPGYELDKVEIDNYPSSAPFVDKISNSIVKQFGLDIHNLWKTLIRKFNPSKLCQGCETSLLPLKHAFVIPGGRFREFYYWDSFFAMEGLNLSGLQSISKDMLQNFLDFVETYGLVPNGARRYFLNRSQPPLLIPAFDRYIQSTNDLNFLKDNLNILEKEYQYWIKNHNVQVNCPPGVNDNCYLTRYIVNNNQPRPESYREDFKTVEEHTNFSQQEINQLYADLATGAESGWDYSTRWIPDFEKRVGGTQEELLRGIRTSSVIPVDLNSILYLNEITLAKFHRQLIPHNGKCPSKKEYHLKQANEYEHAASKRSKIMHHLMWNPKESSFYDYILNSPNSTSGSQHHLFALSNYWPFWTGALATEFKQHQPNFINVFDMLMETLYKSLGGSPTTLTLSKLQWDFPNSWAPLEYVLVEGIINSANRFDKKSPQFALLNSHAKKVATQFVTAALCAWSSSGGPEKGLLFEKYNVTKLGLIGGGGEYNIQSGFGWTNGVISHFLNLYPDIQGPTDLNLYRFPYIKPNNTMPYGQFKIELANS